ncbi:MAG: hypothetical protein PHU66_11310, partial [Bacteroidaceae bacterium]|nr:hypothetical protein [Bacteroidaceae bacterium]
MRRKLTLIISWVLALLMILVPNIPAMAGKSTSIHLHVEDTDDIDTVTVLYDDDGNGEHGEGEKTFEMKKQGKKLFVIGDMGEYVSDKIVAFEVFMEESQIYHVTDKKEPGSREVMRGIEGKGGTINYWLGSAGPAIEVTKEVDPLEQFNG